MVVFALLAYLVVCVAGLVILRAGFFVGVCLCIVCCSVSTLFVDGGSELGGWWVVGCCAMIVWLVVVLGGFACLVMIV